MSMFMKKPQSPSRHSRQPTRDTLELSADKNFAKCLRSAQTADDALALRRLGPGVTERVLLSCYAIKMSSTSGKPQKRVLAVTNLAIYNLKPGKLKHYQRRIRIEKVGSLQLAVPDPATFVIHFDADVSDEYDYTYRTSHRDQVVSVIRKAYRALRGGNELPVERMAEAASSLASSPSLAVGDGGGSRGGGAAGGAAGGREDGEDPADELQELEEEVGVAGAMADAFGLGSDKRVEKCIRGCQSTDDLNQLRRLGPGTREEVQLSCLATKTRDTDGKCQKRVLAVTNLAIYNFKPGKYKTFQRRILIDRIASILTFRDDPGAFVIHFEVLDEYDYVFRSGRSAKVIAAIRAAHFALVGERLEVEELDGKEIDLQFKTKKHMAQELHQKRHGPAGSSARPGNSVFDAEGSSFDVINPLGSSTEGSSRRLMAAISEDGSYGWGGGSSRTLATEPSTSSSASSRSANSGRARGAGSSSSSSSSVGGGGHRGDGGGDGANGGGGGGGGGGGDDDGGDDDNDNDEGPAPGTVTYGREDRDLYVESDSSVTDAEEDAREAAAAATSPSKYAGGGGGDMDDGLHRGSGTGAQQAAMSSATRAAKSRAAGMKRHVSEAPFEEDHFADKGVIMDQLGLGADKKFIKCLKHCRTSDDTLVLRKLGADKETVQLSCMAVKTSSTSGKPQKRVLAVTNLAIYNFKPGKYKTFQRRILIDRVASLLLASDDQSKFVVHFEVLDEHDYEYRSEYRKLIVNAVGQVFEVLTGKKLPTPALDGARAGNVLSFRRSFRRSTGGFFGSIEEPISNIIRLLNESGFRAFALVFSAELAGCGTDTDRMHAFAKMLYNNLSFSIFVRVFQTNFNIAWAVLQTVRAKLLSRIFEEQHWAIKILWQLLRILERLKFLGGERAVTIFCEDVLDAVPATGKFTPRARDALLQLMLGRVAVDGLACDGGGALRGGTLGRPIQNGALFPLILHCSTFASSGGVLRETLRNLSLLFHRNHRNLEWLIAQKDWADWALPLLSQLPAKRSSAEEAVYVYINRLYGLAHAHIFRSPGCTVDGTFRRTIKFVENFVGSWSPHGVAVVRVWLRDLVASVRRGLGRWTKSDFAPEWAKVFELTRVIEEFVLQRPVATSAADSLVEDGGGGGGGGGGETESAYVLEPVEVRPNSRSMAASSTVSLDSVASATTATGRTHTRSKDSRRGGAASMEGGGSEESMVSINFSDDESEGTDEADDDSEDSEVDDQGPSASTSGQHLGVHCDTSTGQCGDLPLVRDIIQVRRERERERERES